MSRGARGFLGLALAAWSCGALAETSHQRLPDIAQPVPQTPGSARWYFQTSAATIHFNPNSEHNNEQQLFNVERHHRGEWLIGGAYFQNSFNQTSEYVYGGRIWRAFDRLPSLHIKLTGGLVHGYKGEYQNNIPLNGLGVAPAILPAIGLSGRRFATELVVFGTSGVMWNVGFFLY